MTRPLTSPKLPQLLSPPPGARSARSSLGARRPPAAQRSSAADRSSSQRDLVFVFLRIGSLDPEPINPQALLNPWRSSTLNPTRIYEPISENKEASSEGPGAAIEGHGQNPLAARGDKVRALVVLRSGSGLVRALRSFVSGRWVQALDVGWVWGFVWSSDFSLQGFKGKPSSPWLGMPGRLRQWPSFSLEPGP